MKAGIDPGRPDLITVLCWILGGIPGIAPTGTRGTNSANEKSNAMPSGSSMCGTAPLEPAWGSSVDEVVDEGTEESNKLAGVVVEHCDAYIKPIRIVTSEYETRRTGGI